MCRAKASQTRRQSSEDMDCSISSKSCPPNGCQTSKGRQYNPASAVLAAGGVAQTRQGAARGAHQVLAQLQKRDGVARIVEEPLPPLRSHVKGGWPFFEKFKNFMPRQKNAKPHPVGRGGSAAGGEWGVQACRDVRALVVCTYVCIYVCGTCAYVSLLRQAAVRRRVSTPRLQQAARQRLAAIACRIEGRGATRGWLARAFPCKPRARSPGESPARDGDSEPSVADVSIETRRRVHRLEELAGSDDHGAHLGFDDDSRGEGGGLCASMQPGCVCARPGLHRIEADSTRPAATASGGSVQLGPGDGRPERAADEWPCETQERFQFDTQLSSTLDTLSSAVCSLGLSAIWDRDLSFSSADESLTSELQQHEASCQSAQLRERTAAQEPATPPGARDATQASLFGDSLGQRSPTVCVGVRGAGAGAIADSHERAASACANPQLDASGYLSALSCTSTPPNHRQRALHVPAISSDSDTDGARKAGEVEDVVLRRMILQQELEWTRQALQSRKTHLKRSRLSTMSATAVT